MLKKQTYILFLGLTIGLFACSETSADEVVADIEETAADAKENLTDANSESAESSNEDDSASDKYSASWEAFKAAVIKKDIKAVSAYATSDEIDAEMIVQAFSDPEFLAGLKKGKYKDLKVDRGGDEGYLVFSCDIEGSDDEGNIYESGLYLYFSKGKNGLLLENFLAAG